MVNTTSVDLSLVLFSSQSYPPAQRTAALFLLTFQEQYKLSQTAINSIVNNVCDSVQESVRSSLDSGFSSMDVAACFDDHRDPFSSLQTEYKQSKFYREEFVLVVSCGLVYVIIFAQL